MSEAADKQKKQAVLQRLREKQKPAVPESVAPSVAGAAAGDRKEKLKKMLQGRSGGDAAQPAGGRREKLRQLLQRGSAGESEGAGGRKEKLKRLLEKRSEAGEAGAAGGRGQKLRQLLQRGSAGEGEGAGGRKEKLKRLLEKRAEAGEAGAAGGRGQKLRQLLQGRSGGQGGERREKLKDLLKGRGGAGKGQFRNKLRERAGQGEDQPEAPVEDLPRPGLREFASRPPSQLAAKARVPRRDEGVRLTAEQLMQPPRMDFKRAIRNAAELHSSSLDEVKARREDLGYRAEWLRAVLTMTEQELQLVDEALAIMSQKAAAAPK